ncbi:MAG: PilN domain-containing protein [Sinobacteraceae bacterium]|nr:PilN domain-containing protein [Nevskiaceae bacterium]
MTRINLLDWRAERRKRRQQRFLALLALAAIAAILVVLFGDLGMQQAVEYQRSRNDFLKKQIAQIDAQIKEIQELEKVRRNLIERMRVIEQLQQSRSATVHFFDEIVNTLPDGVYLTSLKQNGKEVTIEGVAESNGRISAYMKNLDASPWFKDPKLVVIKTSTKTKFRASDFTLQVTNLTQQAESSNQVATGSGGP